jgi:hypothetical protein
MTIRKMALTMVLLGILAGAQPIWAQTWTITKVVDNTTACPGSQGVFNPATLFPAINGPWVVFLDSGDDSCTSNDGPSIWSYNLITKALVKLVDTNTPIPFPAGAGNFVGLTANCCDNNLQVNDGTVLFFGYGAGYNPTYPNCSGGLYTVSVTGGEIFRVVDYTMTLPGYGGSFCALNTSYGINGLVGMSLDRGQVVFSAEAVGSGGSNTGVWRAPANVNTTESQLHLIADASTVYQSPFPPGCAPGFCQTINQWEGGFLGATATAFTGGGQTGADGLFVNSPSSPILLSSYVLPGDTAHNTSYPDNASFYIGPIVDGANIFFLATDPFYLGTCANGGSGNGIFSGVFKTGLGGGAATSIMNTCNTQPNGDSLGANSFNQLAADEGTAVFPALDNTTGNYVLDSSVNGVVSQILAPGNSLPSGASCDGTYHAVGCATTVSPTGTGGINGGRVVFNAEGGPYWYDEGIYVASLPCASAVTSDVTVSLGTLTYSSTTKTWSQTATVKNSGNTAIAGPLSLVLANLTHGVTLTNRNGTTVCFAPEGSSYIDFYLPANNELAVGKTTQTTLEFSDPSNAGISFHSEVAGAGAR